MRVKLFFLVVMREVYATSETIVFLLLYRFVVPFAVAQNLVTFATGHVTPKLWAREYLRLFLSSANDCCSLLVVFTCRGNASLNYLLPPRQTAEAPA